MAILRTLNEFASEGVVLAIEPSRQCIAGCSYCFAALNSKIQAKGHSKDFTDTGTFESIYTRAFSASYDPTNFCQWSIKNRMALAWANSVEPFQDSTQALAILRVCDRASIPLFIQTKGVNFSEVFSALKPFHDNSSIFVSFPTLDNRVIKRFEPGTPRAEERRAMIETLANAGFQVTLALSPYVPEWCEDPGAFIEQAISWGISAVFLDPLHLSQRQRKVATDPVMAKLALRTENMKWSSQLISHVEIIHRICGENNIYFNTPHWTPNVFGLYNTMPTCVPPGSFRRGIEWPYHDGDVRLILAEAFHDDEFEQEYGESEEYDGEDSILVTWDNVLSIMEDSYKCTQEFSWSSLSDLIILKNLSAPWREILKPKALISEYYRALWNSPSKRQFVWRDSFTRIAMKSDGTAWTDLAGNAVLLYDPYWGQNTAALERTVESLDDFRTLSLEDVNDA